MSTNDFDRLLAEKAKQATFAYEPQDWENLTIQLAKARRKKRAVLFAYTASGIAASVFFLVIGLSHVPSKKEPVATLPLQKTKNKIIAPAPVSPFVPVYTPAQAVAGKPVTRNHKMLAATIGAVVHQPENAPANAIAGSTIAIQRTITGAGSVANSTAVKEPVNKVPQAELPPKPADAGLPLPMSFPQPEAVVVKKPVTISVGGGVSYGTLNTGYALNAIAGKKISNRMDIEIAIGYLNNNSTTIAGGGGYIPVNGLIPKPVTNNATPLNYIQFAPVADYHLSPKLSIGAGADVQRLLQDHDVIVLYNDKQKLAPPTDFGLLLQTGYTVTKRLKGGVLYRIGVNNIVSAGNNYVDRTYLQVQLKYRLH